MLWIEVTFKNTGQSPASEVTAEFTPGVWLVGTGPAKVIDQIEHFSEAGKSIEGGIIGSGDKTIPFGTVWTFSADDYPKFSLAEKFGTTDRLFVSAALSFGLTWLDVFGKRQIVYGSVNVDDFGRSEIAGQVAITATGEARNEDFDVHKWVERKKRQAGNA